MGYHIQLVRAFQAWIYYTNSVYVQLGKAQISDTEGKEDSSLPVIFRHLYDSRNEHPGCSGMCGQPSIPDTIA